MKAFMSTQATWTDRCSEHLRLPADCAPERSALAEATRILAVAEPITEANRLYVSYTLQSHWSEDTEALADALSLFCTKEQF